MNDAILSMMQRYNCRYSEDLDFSLEVPDAAFDLASYLSYVEKELKAYNFSMTVRKKEKTKEAAVQSAFIKGNTVQNILEITSNDASVYGMNPQALLKIKFEVDTNPPEGAEFQYMNAINPATYRVRLYDMPSLFAGKIHAVLCRDYKHRVKGRDFYDYIRYLKRNCAVNLMHLQRRMEQSEKWDPEEDLTMTEKDGLEFWSADFFIDITERYLQ